MLNQLKFDHLLKQYNKEMNDKIRSMGLEKLSELKLRQALTKEIVGENQGKEFNLDSEHITNIINNEDYRELHKILQQVFNQYIPFIMIRRFLQKLDTYAIERVCNAINQYKNLSYSDAIGYIR